MSKIKTYKIDQLPVHSDEHVDVRALRCQRAMVTFVTLRPTGADYIHPPHRHPFEQMLIVTEGTLMVQIANDEHEAPAGSSIILPANVWHTARALPPEPVRFMEILAPAREDWVHLTRTQAETYAAGDTVSWFATEADRMQVVERTSTST